MSVLITSDFFTQASEMRAEFEEAVRPDRVVTVRRLCWDYWYVAGQFGYIRTFARNFFSPALYRSFGQVLSRWGQAQLGCSAWTEPWLSYYISGCRQEFHSDVLHGPWAWVFSLTMWDTRHFSGGETVLLEARVLDYWRHFHADTPSEATDLFRRVEPRFNQLTVFDSRIPHAVAPIEGTRDPLDSRVVIHGWFLPPRLRVDGALAYRDIETACSALIADWGRQRLDLGRLNGVLTARISVGPSGAVGRAEVLASTLVSLDQRDGAVADSVELAMAVVAEARFRESDGPSTLTLPFIAADR